MGTRRRPIFAAKRRKYAQAGGAVDTDVSASQSIVTLSASSGETGTTLTLTITARNAAGQGLSGKAITSVTIDPVGAASVSGSGDTNVAGVATRTLTLGDVGTGNTVTVVCDGVTLDDEPIFDVTGAPSALVWAETVWAPGSLPQSVWAPGVWEGMT